MLQLYSKLTDTSVEWVSLIYTVLRFTNKSEISDAWHGVCKKKLLSWHLHQAISNPGLSCSKQG